MPDTPTPRLGLHRPVGGDDADVPFDLGELTDQLDTLVPYDEGARASRPAPGIPGRIYRSTDDRGIDLDAGTLWETLRSGQGTSLPVAPSDYERFLLLVDAASAAGGPHLWDLIYRTATSGAYKWHAVAAAPLLGQAGGAANTSYQTLLSLTAPVSGVYVFEGGVAANSANDFAALVARILIGGTPAWTEVAGWAFSDEFQWSKKAHVPFPPRAMTVLAGQTISVQVRTVAQTATVDPVALSVRPLRLG